MEIDEWFVLDTGALIRVALLLYENDAISKIATEHISGSHLIYSMDEWNNLNIISKARRLNEVQGV